MAVVPVLFNILGAVSFVLTVIALYLLGFKSPKAFLIFGLSCFVQMYVFWQTGQWFLFAQMAVINVFNGRNYIIYRRDINE